MIKVSTCYFSASNRFFFFLIIKCNQLWNICRRWQWHPTPVLSPGKSHGRRSLVGCSPWGCLESDTTERLHFHFSLSCIGEGNGNPLQCSCLENPRDGGAWWAAVYGVAQSQTRLKWLSSSSSMKYMYVVLNLRKLNSWYQKQDIYNFLNSMFIPFTLMILALFPYICTILYQKQYESVHCYYAK